MYIWQELQKNIENVQDKQADQRRVCSGRVLPVTPLAAPADTNAVWNGSSQTAAGCRAAACQQARYRRFTPGLPAFQAILTAGLLPSLAHGYATQDQS